MRTWKCRLVFYFALVLFFWAQWGTPATAEQAVRIGTSKFWANVPLYVGTKLGLFDKEGVKVQLIEVGNPNIIIEGIAAGDLEGGAVTGPHYLNAVDKRVGLTAVATLVGPREPPTSYVVLKGSGIKSVADLRGKTIAVNNYGGIFDLYLRYMLERNGLNPKKDVTILELPLPAGLKSLVAGKVDGAAITSEMVLYARTQLADKVEVLFDYNDVSPFKPKKLSNMILALSNKLLTERRDTARGFMKAYLRAIEVMKNESARAKAIWQDYSGAEFVGKNELPMMPENGRVELEEIEFQIKLMKQFGYLEGALESRKVVDTRLIDEAIREK